MKGKMNTTEQKPADSVVLKAIRRTCLSCVSEQPEEVKNCTASPETRGFECSLWEHRFGRPRKLVTQSPKEAARKYCLQCMGGSYSGVRECAAKPESEFPCHLWPHRLGANV